jgi:glucose/arabinose dehydrogenase
MRYFFLRILPASLVMLLTARVLELTAAPKSVRKPYGLEKRVAWTTYRVVGSPDPPDPYRTEIAFPGVRFYEALSMAYDASSNRFWLAERKGKIFSFANDSTTTTKDLALDLGRTVYGIALHPRFAENGYLYVASVLDPDVPSPKGSRVSRFQISRAAPFTADPKSEKIIFEWPSGGHNGGCLRFGPDGYLYIATGDGSGIADQLETGGGRAVAVREQSIFRAAWSSQRRAERQCQTLRHFARAEARQFRILGSRLGERAARQLD